MGFEADKNSSHGRLRIDAFRFAAIVRGDPAVDFRTPFWGDFRGGEFSAGQALFQDIGKIYPIFRRQSQRLLGYLFANRHDTVPIE
jgi:hypothetical protein